MKDQVHDASHSTAWFELPAYKQGRWMKSRYILCERGTFLDTDTHKETNTTYFIRHDGVTCTRWFQLSLTTIRPEASAATAFGYLS